MSFVSLICKMGINSIHFIGMLWTCVNVCIKQWAGVSYLGEAQKTLFFLLLLFERSLDDPIQPSYLTEEEIGFRRLIALTSRWQEG